MESNKDEAARCIELAEKYIKKRSREKAEKFLHKAEKLFPTQKAKDLLLQINLIAPSSPETEQPRKRKVPQKVDEPEKKAADYTPEQEEAVKRIRKCKDYYEILCVSKDATDSQIKKAYKKLALQMHPDKNKCPGATEAFKAVGNAVAVLTDPEKRMKYDLHRALVELMATYRGRRWQRQTSGNQQEHQTNQNQYHSHHREQKSGFRPFILILPILLAIAAIPLLMASIFFIPDPAYSLQASSKYPIQRKTQNLGFPYYVKENFHTEYQGSVTKLEISVEEEYISYLRHVCHREKNYSKCIYYFLYLIYLRILHFVQGILQFLEKNREPFEWND